LENILSYWEKISGAMNFTLLTLQLQIRVQVFFRVISIAQAIISKMRAIKIDGDFSEWVVHDSQVSVF
jgi:hypothetical protein